MKKIVVDSKNPLVVVLVESNTFLFAHELERLCKGTVLIADQNDKSETIMTALQETVSTLKKRQNKQGFFLRAMRLLIKTLRRRK
ncbi:hypothetical protein [Sulfurospirillum sp. DNRA8]|uniref:hypothetical protein n=1 Tax=Sulfurospirillum TaxID=57665 RepID=UPI00339D98EA|nr:hypothetical protein [Sulfurospirillum sp. DNRA8]MCR1812092.1 hypothetical protein [Sulfurospirillum sp. DNRA8]